MIYTIRYGLISLFLVYGILVEEGLYIPTRGTGSGKGFIIVAILMFFLSFLIDYIDSKDTTAEDEFSTPETTIDYICFIFVLLGLIYFGLFLFEVVNNYYVFIIFVLSFGFCGKSVRKFLF